MLIHRVILHPNPNFMENTLLYSEHYNLSSILITPKKHMPHVTESDQAIILYKAPITGSDNNHILTVTL